MSFQADCPVCGVHQFILGLLIETRRSELELAAIWQHSFWRVHLTDGQERNNVWKQWRTVIPYCRKCGALLDVTWDGTTTFYPGDIWVMESLL